MRIAKASQDFYNDGRKAGYKAGRHDRGLETVEYHIIKYWRWGEWFTYSIISLFTVVIIIFAFWIVGIFIRWEVGPIPHILSEYPFDSEYPFGKLNEGWESVYCHKGTSPHEYDVTCYFNRNNHIH